MVLTNETKAEMFRALANKSSFEVGIQYGLDKHYKSAQSVGTTVIRIFNAVKNNPDLYKVSLDTVDLVAAAVKGRTQMVRSGEQKLTLKEQLEKEKDKTIEELALTNRQKAWMLLNLRLDDLLSSKKNRQKVSIGEVAKVAGITFDKGQLVAGKATEHVSIMSKIKSEDMSPTELIEMAIKMREFNNSVQDAKLKE